MNRGRNLWDGMDIKVRRLATLHKITTADDSYHGFESITYIYDRCVFQALSHFRAIPRQKFHTTWVSLEPCPRHVFWTSRTYCAVGLSRTLTATVSRSASLALGTSGRRRTNDRYYLGSTEADGLSKSHVRGIRNDTYQGAIPKY